VLNIDLTGKRAFVAGVADDKGFGFAIAKALAEAGAKVSIGTWPPALGILENLLRRGKLDEALRLSDGSKLEFERIFPLDAAYDTLDEVPEEVRSSKRYAGRGDFTIEGVRQQWLEAFGPASMDVVVHSLANGPEVHKPLLETSRHGYLGAVSVSAYSMVSMIQRLGTLMPPGASALSLTYLASERVIPGYGGGMNAAKAALESDTRVLAHQAGRKWGLRINTISAGPYASRAASVTGIIHDIIGYYSANAPLTEPLAPEEVAAAAAFLSSSLASGITGTTIYVDKGYHVMGKGSA
jgi:enoyl-[acyl-carrier protein] reductase I